VEGCHIDRKAQTFAHAEEEAGALVGGGVRDQGEGGQARLASGCHEDQCGETRCVVAR